MIYPFLYDRHNEHRKTLFLKAVGSFKGYEIICRGPLIGLKQEIIICLFQFLCQLLKPTAYRIIKRLADEGKLKNIASAHSPVYVPVEGWNGK